MALYLLDSISGRKKVALSLIENDPSAKVVLIQNGVFLNPHPFKEKGTEVFAVKADVEKRGVKNRLPEFVKIIDYHELVDLIFNSERVINLA